MVCGLGFRVQLSGDCPVGSGVVQDSCKRGFRVEGASVPGFLFCSSVRPGSGALQSKTLVHREVSRLRFF